jgi:predicted sulfurtransferase
MGKIILYYKYVSIQYPVAILKWHKALCTELELTGRIIIAHEGVNATVAGSDEQIERYKLTVSQHPLFGDIDFKESPGDASYFPRMRIVVKNEIVNLGIDPTAVTTKDTGTHLTPQQVHALINNKTDNLVILDARNEFESKVGKFIDAVTPPIDYFRQLPAYIDSNLEQFKDKEVLMYCTGGIRCERATAYLNLKNVAKKVYQIEGGIHRYIEQYPDGHFRGKNYVFDGRVTVRVNDDILSTCTLCPAPCDEYENCLNATCNKHFICCKNCVIAYGNSCSKTCQELLAAGLVAPRPMRKKVDVISTESTVHAQQSE